MKRNKTPALLVSRTVEKGRRGGKKEMEEEKQKISRKR